MEKLSKFTQTQPHATNGTFTLGLSSKWNYLLRVTDWEKNQLDGILESLQKAIQSRFTPALTGQPPPGEHTRELLAILAWLGGPGLLNPLASAPEQRAASQQICTPIIGRIINQGHRLDGCHAVQQSIKIRIQQNNRQNQKEDAENLQRTCSSMLHGTLSGNESLHLANNTSHR